MNKKLEILQHTTYICPICWVPYMSLIDAEECRDRGFIGEGPEIKPGLVVKGIFDGVYSVFFREFQKMHYRYDEFSNFKKNEILEPVSQLELNGYAKRDSINEMKPRINLLDENEFEEFKILINRDIDFEKFGLDAEYALKNLYRYHDWFENNNYPRTSKRG